MGSNFRSEKKRLSRRNKRRSSQDPRSRLTHELAKPFEEVDGWIHCARSPPV